MIGGHHQFNEHEFEEAPGDGEDQRSLVCCSPWGHKDSDMTEQLITSSTGLTVSILLRILFKKVFNWRIIALQRCVGFC